MVLYLLWFFFVMIKPLTKWFNNILTLISFKELFNFNFTPALERRKGMQPTLGNTLGRGKTSTYLTANFQTPWSYPCPKWLCPHSTSPFFSWWLNAIYMRSTATKSLLPQITYCDRHMFLIVPWEDNHCFSLILWKQRKMC